MTTPAMNAHQQDAPFLFESLASIKDESSEHSMDLPMATMMNLPVKQEEEEQSSSSQPMKSLRASTSQKSGKGKPVPENRSYAGEISKKRARRVCTLSPR